MINETFHIINRKSVLSSISKDYKSKMMFKMFLTLSSIDENSVGSEINKYFIKIIPENKTDLLVILLSLSKRIPKEIQLKKDGVYTIIHNIISKTFCRNNTLVFNQYNINDLGKLFAYIFSLDLKGMKIKTYESLKEKIALFLSSNKSIILEYENYRRNMPYDPKAKTNVYEMFKDYKQRKKELNIPIELAFAVQKLLMITKLSLQFEYISEPVFNLALIVLLNYKLLFPNVKLVELNLRNHTLVREIFKRHQNQLAKNTEEQIKQINIDSEEYLKLNYTMESVHIDISDDVYKNGGLFDLHKVNTIDSTNDFSDPEDKVDNGSNNNHINNKTNNVTILSKVEEKLINYCDILQEQKKLFELGIIFPYFISLWTEVQSLNIIAPYNFGREIEDALSYNYKVIFVGYHYFNFFYPIKNLRQLTFEFNSLDYDTFDKLISFIHLNEELKSLTLSFFGIELYYLPSALFQMINKLRINVNHLLNQGSETALKNYDTEEFSQLLIEYFLNNFEENIEKLFWLIKGDILLTEINFFFVSPTLISNHEGYITIITKFILNCFLLLNSPGSKYNTLKLIAPYVYLDSKRMQDMTEIIDGLDYKKNNTVLTSLTIQLQFFNVLSIGNMLGYNLIELNIGDLDIKSFNAFITKLTDPEYTSRSKLQKVNVSLLNRVNQFTPIKKSVMNYFSMWIRTLNEIGIATHIHMSPEQLSFLYQEINFNSVRRYCITMNKTCEFLHKNTPQLFYYEYYAEKSKVAYIINKVLLAYVKHRPDKVYHRLLSLLVPGKDKELIVTFK